ncbi:MAG: tetratricopeptide repeat protein [Bacteroidales bacterium]
MTGRFKIFIKCIGLCLCLSVASINAQILQDTTSLNLVKKNIDYIYNLQFNNAREVHSKISRLYPGHPVVFLLNGIITYWENYPMLSTTPARDSFEEDMRRCITLCENNNSPDHEAEYLLADLCARGMLLMFYADNDLIMEVIPLMTGTYQYLRRSFDFTSVCTDLNYFTGLYNYYREAYPKAYPVYKPLALLFPGGDMEIGLKELKSAAINSVVLRAESYFLLTWIYLNFENNYPEALFYSKSLHELYPDNVLYLALYIKNLLLMRQYDEAEKLIIASPDEAGNRYFQAQLTIFKGILKEKKYLDNKLAQQYYKKGISDISIFGGYGNEYAAYAYYGLGRISVANGEKHSGKIYRKKAMELADFKKINFDK